MKCVILYIRGNGAAGSQRSEVLGILLEQGRTEDLRRSLEDTEYQRELFHEFG